jgi:hypothetical protein
LPIGTRLGGSRLGLFDPQFRHRRIELRDLLTGLHVVALLNIDGFEHAGDGGLRGPWRRANARAAALGSACARRGNADRHVNRRVLDRGGAKRTNIRGNIAGEYQVARRRVRSE